MGKISEFTELTSADAEDLLPIVDTSAGVTKKIRIDSLGVNLSTLAEVDAVAPTDKMLLYDVSASAYKSVEAGDVGINISTLTEVNAIASGDKIPVYDVSTSTNKYVEAGDLMTGSLTQGLYSALPTLAVDAQYYCTDKDLLYLGTALGNKIINDEYDRIAGKLTQSGTNAPTITWLNSFPGSQTITRVSEGYYRITINAGYTLNASTDYVIVSGGGNAGTSRFGYGVIYSSSQIDIYTIDGSDGLVTDNTGLYGTPYMTFVINIKKINRS